MTLCFIGCKSFEKPSFENPLVFGEAFFYDLCQSNDIDHFFISESEYQVYYDSLKTLLLSDTLRPLDDEAKDVISVLPSAKLRWKENYFMFRDSLNLRKAKMDSLHFDYIIARAGKDVQILWPVSTEHEPDIYGAHYAKIKVFFSLNKRSYQLVFLPFFTGKKWVFDITSDHEIMCYGNE